MIFQSFRVGISKNKNIDHGVKKLVLLLCPHKLHMKPIQRCKVHQIFVSYVFYCNVKEKDHIRRNINSKKKKCLYVKSVLFLFAKN